MEFTCVICGGAFSPRLGGVYVVVADGVVCSKRCLDDYGTLVEDDARHASEVMFERDGPMMLAFEDDDGV